MPSLRDFLQLPFRWRITRQHLDAAIEGIRAEHESSDVQPWLAEAADFLAHNELECALHDLEQACACFVPSSAIWELLATAADSMSLSERASALRRRANGLSTEPSSNGPEDA